MFLKIDISALEYEYFGFFDFDSLFNIHKDPRVKEKPKNVSPLKGKDHPMFTLKHLDRKLGRPNYQQVR